MINVWKFFAHLLTIYLYRGIFSGGIVPYNPPFRGCVTGFSIRLKQIYRTDHVRCRIRFVFFPFTLYLCPLLVDME